MTRRDFTLIARVLGRHYTEDERLVLSIVASLTVALRKDNPEFKSERFLQAVLDTAKEQEDDGA